MNILEAKNEIKNTVKIYLSKDEYGNYAMPIERQRPVLLIGAPGIGKTAIMERIAEELGIGYLSYTITHHTRQSAVGLPFISEKIYGGQKYSVTEYTMSEIVAEVYDAIEKQGKKEGILFIDEINCVSETLAPAMLELLQHKKFGTHKIPDGWILVSAGNPEEYNKSVNELDMVTLDRVKKMVVEPDYDAFKAYAVSNGIHGSVLGFLSLNIEYLFKAQRTPNGYEFVTPRGWEDLSYALIEYEKAGLTVTLSLISEYVQIKDGAEKFYKFYGVYCKNADILNGDKIEKGEIKDFEIQEDDVETKLSIVEISLSKINKIIDKALNRKSAKEFMKEVLNGDVLKSKAELTVEKILADDKSSRYKKSAYKPIIGILKGENLNSCAEVFIKESEKYIDASKQKCENVLKFAYATLKKSSYLSLLLSEISAGENFVDYLSVVDFDYFYTLNDEVMVGQSDDKLQKKAKSLCDSKQA